MEEQLKTEQNMSLEHSAEIGKLAESLAKVQLNMRSIKKDSKGYGYSYTSLSEMSDQLLPLLAKEQLAVTQFSDAQDNLVTMLIHSSGQFIKGRMKLIDIEMKGVNEAQKRGSILSYFRRYSLGAITGLTSNDEDNDAASNVEKSSSDNSSRKTKFIKREVKNTQGESNEPIVGGF